MKIANKLLALLLTLALLVSVPVVAFAEGEVADLFPASADILNSITTEETTGNGLAFLFEMNVRGAAVNGNKAVLTNAVATVDGKDYAVTAMGAVMVNQAADIANIDNITRDKADGKYILDINAAKLCYVEEDSCSFAVRIIRLPDEVKGFAIAARPYVVLKNGDEEITLYGNDDIATYNQVLYGEEIEPTPVWNADVPKPDDKLEISVDNAEYVAYETTNYKEAFKITATLENVSANAKTSEGDTITYVCKDAEGNELGNITVVVNEIAAGDTLENVEFYAPVGTATIEAAELNLNYVPDIIMPDIGSDIDVSKKKNRIRISAAEASFNEDGTIHVKWTFKNYTSNWITEETDYIKYAYYKGNTRKGLVTLYIGVIDTKKHPVKTFEFDVPAYTTKVAITSSVITYWTEWA